MPNILDILARAQSLMNETALNSITPPRAGGIMYDTLLVLNQMQLEGASLLISKVYASVSAMEADTTPTSDLTGRALKPGQLVVIVTSDTSSSDMGSEYRYNGPGSWTYVGKVGGLPLDTVPTQGSTKGITSGAVFQTKKDLEEQTDQLEAEVDEFSLKVGDPADAFQPVPIQMAGGYFDVTGVSVSPSPTSSTRIFYCEIPCTPGKQFKVYGYGGTTARLWCFIDDSRNVLSVADESVNARTTPAELTAPASSAVLIYQATGYDVSKDKVENPLPVKIADTLDGTNETKWTAEEQTLTLDKWYNTGTDPLPNNPSANTGCACIKMSVQEGDIFRITGVASSTGRLWATADSSRNKIRRAGTNYQRRSCPEIVTIENGESLLYVTLWTYDSQTDKVEKLTSATEHEKGLIERVELLEARHIPTTIDSLGSTSTTDPLSANQGRVLNEQINGVTSETQTDQTLTPDKYFNTQNSRIPATPDLLSDSSNTYCCLLYVTPGEVYRIYGKGESSTHQLYALADSDRYVIAGGVPGVSMNTRATPLDLTIPEGVAMLAVNLYQYDAATDKVQKIGSVTSTCVKTRLNALEQADEDLSALALPLKGKKVMFFGDSITDITYNGKGIVSYFQEQSKASCYKAAISGTRFVQRTTPADTPTTNSQAYAALDICNMVKAWCEGIFTQQDAAVAYLDTSAITARVNTLKNNPIAGFDIVCIGGGTNDMSNSSPIGNDTDSGFTTLKGSINKMIELLLTANPKLKIYFYSPVVGYHGEGGRIDANWDDNHQFSSGLTKPEYIDIFTARTKANHIPYINLYWTLGINQTNFSQYYLDDDDHHPYKGLDILGRRLYQQVVTNLE